MCSQDAGNVISEPLSLKIFRGAYPRTHLGVIKYESPPQIKPKLYTYDSEQSYIKHTKHTNQ